MWFIAYPGHSYIYETPTDFFQSPWYLFFVFCCCSCIERVFYNCLWNSYKIQTGLRVCSIYIFCIWIYIPHIYKCNIYIWFVDWLVCLHACLSCCRCCCSTRTPTHTHKAVQREGKHMCVGCCVFLSYFCICIFIFVWHKVWKKWRKNIYKNIWFKMIRN